MNLRTLKKLSKKAAPLLPVLGDCRKQFRAEKGDSYTGLVITDRKHWDRGRSVHADCYGEHMIKRPAKDGKGYVYLRPPHGPRKGTIMVGATTGYYEPEWDEETAWEALFRLVADHFTDWQRDVPRLERSLGTPRLVFLAAAEIVKAA